MRTTSDSVKVIRADMVPPDGRGKYRIEACGLSLDSNYAINRMAKALFDRGYRGRMEVYGPSADDKWIILRLTGDIEKMAARRLVASPEVV